MKNNLRIAILTNNSELFNWQLSILNEIANTNYAELEVHINVSNVDYKKAPKSWRIFSDFDRFLFKPSPNALASVEVGALFKKTLGAISLETLDIEKLKDYQLDILINLSGFVPTKNIISSFKYGIWNLTFLSTKSTKQGPPGAWELIQDFPEIGAQLQYIRAGITNPIVLDQTSVCTDWISYSRNANMILWQAAPLISRNLKRLYDFGEVRSLGGMSSAECVTSDNPAPPYKYPGTRLLIWHSIKTINKKIAQLIESQFYFDQWILLFTNSSDDSKFELSRYNRILPPKDRFWADPFLIKRDGKYYLFIEELIYKDKLGHLAVMELDENGNYTTPKIILKKDYHLSYPFLIEDNDNLYMIPETGSNKDIQLYKCTNFPFEWELEKVLMHDVIAVDTTVYKKNNLYWMFTNLKVHKGMSSNVELFLFYSKELVSDQWTPHPLNPIVTDVKKSRPAGQLFVDGNKLIRPSQNCSHHYGFGMNLNRITKLDSTNFEEQIEYSISPKWVKDVLCTHTFNTCDMLNISDAQIRRWKFF